ncbi:MAG: pyridoxal phosphate-dependent aminotransferase [Chlorobi bacterium]|nr:pyridoxal phosphate-dependent aminotransferase [Chlorobiota bacterium]
MSRLFLSDRIPYDTGTNAISRLLERLRRQGVEVLNLTETNPVKAGFVFPLEALHAGIVQESISGYDPHPRGLQEAREAIAGYYEEHGIHVHPEAIYCTSSTSEAYSMLFKLLADPGDEILVPEPSYPLFDYLALFEALKPVPFRLGYGKGAKPMVNRDSVETVCSNRTRALIIVNPNNPTGSYLDEDDRKFLTEFCRRRGIALIVDEVFHDYCFLETKPPSVLSQEMPCLQFTLNGLSKTLCLPQMKLSWFVVSGPLRYQRKAQSRLDILLDFYLSVNTPVQVAAPVLLSRREEIQEAVRLRCRDNLAFLQSTMKEIDGIDVYPVEGGWSVVMKVWRIDDEEEFVLRLLEDHHVLMHPGYFYNFIDGENLVLSLLPSIETFRDGIRRFVKAIYDW